MGGVMAVAWMHAGPAPGHSTPEGSRCLCPLFPDAVKHGEMMQRRDPKVSPLNQELLLSLLSGGNLDPSDGQDNLKMFLEAKSCCFCPGQGTGYFLSSRLSFTSSDLNRNCFYFHGDTKYVYR